MIVNVFLDTEFTDLSKPGSLVSIGLINEDGDRTFYAELTDTYNRATCSEFVLRNVLPALDAKPLTVQKYNNNIYAEMSLSETHKYLQQWLEDQKEPIQIWSDAPHYDWSYIQEIFQAGFPSNLIGTPKSVFVGDASLKELFEKKAVQEYSTSRFIRHHALDDAMVVRLGWREIKSFIASSNQFALLLPYFNNLDLSNYHRGV